MSQPNLTRARATQPLTMASEPVRVPFTVRTSSRRGFDDWLAVKYPGVAVLGTRLAFILPLRWQLRQAMLVRGCRQGLEAFNRGDLEALRASLHPDLELVVEPELVALGFDPVYRGIAGWDRYMKRWAAEWEMYEVHPEELIDLGDRRLVAVGQQRSRSVNGGTTITSDWADIWTLAGGRLIREQPFFSRDDALRTAGLSPARPGVRSP